jgi:alpha-L-arabinofuranosidase
MRYFYIFLFLSAFSNVQAQNDFFKEGWIQKNFTEPQNTIEYPEGIGGDVVYVSVTPHDTVNKVLHTIFGNNLPAYRNNLEGNTSMAEHLKRLNHGTMRIPGGNWSNTWLWDGTNHWDGSNLNGYSGTLKDYDQDDQDGDKYKNYLDIIRSEPTTHWTLTTDKMLQICDDWNVEPQICVNFSLSRYINADNAVQQAAHYAAEWVRDVKSKGFDVKYWEIGNEHYGSWQAGYSVEGEEITGTMYGEGASVFIDSMKKANPDIKIGIVVSPSYTGHNVPNYTVDVLKTAGNKADFLIIHEYFRSVPEPYSDWYAKVLKGAELVKADIDTVQTLVKRYTDKDYMPVAMTEYNIYSKNPAEGRETDGVGILFLAHALGEYVTNNYGLVNIWDVQNGGEDGNDHGMFTFNEDDIDDDIPHPTFFPYYLYNKMFGDALVKSTSDKEGVYVYSSRFSNGYLEITVINETETDKTVNINVPKYKLADTVYRYELNIDSLSSRKVSLNGETSPDGELYGPRNYDDILPYRQTFSSTGQISVGVKKYSVNFFVVREKGYTGILNHKRNSDGMTLRIYPNPVSQQAVIQYSVEKPTRISVELYSQNGRLVKVLKSRNVVPGDYRQSLNVSQLVSGVYFVRIISNGGVVTQQIVINNF